MSKKLISIVLPSYKEEKNVPLIYDELVKILSTLEEKYDYELIYVNDGSPDNTWREILKICDKDEKVKGINLSRNFGKEIALTAGVQESNGDCVITTDVDGQRPAEIIYDFIEKWENKIDIVYAVRKKMKRNIFRKIASNIFNLLMNYISTVKFESGVTDYMLIDRKVVNYLLEYEDKNRIFRGIVLSLGFNQDKVYFVEPQRINGESAWGINKLIKLAIDSITSFSIFPLKMVGYLGLFIVFGAGLLLLFMVVTRFILSDPYSITNTAFFVVFNLLLSGITLSALGVIALYIAKIHEEVIGKPLYLIRDKINFKK